MAGVVGFYHGGITVSDMERSLGFYHGGLGLEVQSDVTLDNDYLREILGVDFSAIRIVFLTIPGGGSVELLEYQGSERMSAACRPCDPGGGHLCLFVDDIDDRSSRLRNEGYRSRSPRPVDIAAGPRKGARTIYFIDPDGFSVELFQLRIPPDDET